MPDTDDVSRSRLSLSFPAWALELCSVRDAVHAECMEIAVRGQPNCPGPELCADTVRIDSGLVRLLDDGTPHSGWASTRDALHQANIDYRLRIGLSDSAMMTSSSRQAGLVPTWTASARPAQYRAAALAHAFTIDDDASMLRETAPLLSALPEVRGEAATQLLECLANRGRLADQAARLDAAGFAPGPDVVSAALQRASSRRLRAPDARILMSLDLLATRAARLQTEAIIRRLVDPLSESRDG